MMRSLPLTRRTLLSGMAATALVPSLGLPMSARAAAKTGGSLKIAVLGLDTADPHRHTGSIAVQQVFVETLTSIADDGSVKPFLAESYEVSDDGKTYSFKLRRGVQFHNGREMTAADVAANFDRVKVNVTEGWLASAMQQVDSFEATAPDQFVVRMSAPYGPFLALISELWIVAPESPGWGDTITQPIGTGPFKFGSWTPQVELVTPRHDAYWQAGLPYLDELRFDLRGSPDNDLAVRAGDLHVATVERDRVPGLEADPNLSVETLKDTGWYFLSFNNRSPNPPLDRPRVREAIAYAIDKAAYMDFVAGDKGIVTNQMVIPGTVYFDQAMHDADKHAKPNLELARQILAEEGVDPAATTLKVISWQEAYAEVAVQMVKQLGFAIEHTALDDLGAQQRLGQYDWDLAPFSSGPRAHPFLRYVRMMSDGPNPVLWGGVQDAQYDALVKQAVSAVSVDEQRKYYSAAWQRVMDNYYTVVIGHAADTFGVRKEAQGFTTGYTWSQHRVDGGVAFTWLDV